MTKSQAPNEQQIPNGQAPMVAERAIPWSLRLSSRTAGLGIGQGSLVILTPHRTDGYNEQPRKSSQKNRSSGRKGYPASDWRLRHSDFVIRASFVIGYLVIRHSTEPPSRIVLVLVVVLVLERLNDRRRVRVRRRGRCADNALAEMCGLECTRGNRAGTAALPVTNPV